MHEGGIEFLVKSGIYEATFNRPGRTSRMDNRPDPIVNIHDFSHPRRNYFGIMVYCTNPGRQETANSIREGVIEEGANFGRFNVIVIGVPAENAHGLYFVIGTKKSPSYEMTAEEAFAVLRGETIFYARYIFKGNEGNPALIGYKDNGIKEGTKEFGFLDSVKRSKRNNWGENTDLETEARKFAECKLTEEMIERLKPGDYLIARQIGQDKATGTLFFEPVIDFLEEDDAKSPTGESLVTKVYGYDKGNIICNLPIISVVEHRGKRGMFGVGHVKRPKDDDKSFYYKPVCVINGAKDFRKYIRETEILDNGEGVILAKKIR